MAKPFIPRLSFSPLHPIRFSSLVSCLLIYLLLAIYPMKLNFFIPFFTDLRTKKIMIMK